MRNQRAAAGVDREPVMPGLDSTIEDRAEAILRAGKVPNASALASEYETSLWAAEKAIERAYDRLDRPARAYKPAKRKGPNSTTGLALGYSAIMRQRVDAEKIASFVDSLPRVKEQK